MALFFMLHLMHILQEFRLAVQIVVVPVMSELINFPDVRRLVLLNASKLVRPFFCCAFDTVLFLCPRNGLVKEHFHHFYFLQSP